MQAHQYILLAIVLVTLIREKGRLTGLLMDGVGEPEFDSVVFIEGPVEAGGDAGGGLSVAGHGEAGGRPGMVSALSSGGDLDLLDSGGLRPASGAALPGEAADGLSPDASGIAAVSGRVRV